MRLISVPETLSKMMHVASKQLLSVSCAAKSWLTTVAAQVVRKRTRKSRSRIDSISHSRSLFEVTDVTVSIGRRII